MAFIEKRERYTRKFRVNGTTRYFQFVEAFYGPEAQADARKLAEEIRTGTRAGLYGQQGPHWVRVVSMNYYSEFNTKYDGLLAHFAVYVFPKN